MHLNQWRSGKQDLVALQLQAVPINTCSDSPQTKATASNSIHNIPVCVTKSTHSPSSPILTLNPTTTTSTSSTSQPSEMSNKIQNSKEPGVCVETGNGRSADSSPHPTQQQYGSSTSSYRKQQNKSKGSYGNSKGKFVVYNM